LSLTVFFPCYNDGPTIGGLVRSAAATARNITSDFEIVVVNDGSRDDSASVLGRLGHEVPQLRVIEHGVNRGYGAALRSGFSAATKDLVFYTDGDGQYNPEELSLLHGRMVPGVDVVNGYKRRRRDPWYRIAIGQLYRRTVGRAFGVRLQDMQCDFRLMRRAVLERVDLQSDGGSICVELVRGLQDAGARFVEVPVTHFPRQHGQSQFFVPQRLWRTLVALAGLWWRMNARKRAGVVHA
jgi:glycosyltransferase involved in cell wall biosynthesis